MNDNDHYQDYIITKKETKNIKKLNLEEWILLC